MSFEGFLFSARNGKRICDNKLTVWADGCPHKWQETDTFSFFSVVWYTCTHVYVRDGLCYQLQMMHAHHSKRVIHALPTTSDYNDTSSRVDIAAIVKVLVDINQCCVSVLMTLFINDHFRLVLSLHEAYNEDNPMISTLTVLHTIERRLLLIHPQLSWLWRRRSLKRRML
jgi:hypothetical protein